MLLYAKELAKRIVPYRIYSPILDLYHYLSSRKYVGDEFECPLCGGHFTKFLPAGFSFPVLKEKQVVGAGYRLNTTCPRCFSGDRERLLYLFLTKTNPNMFVDRIKLLHVAPEKGLRGFFMSHSNIDYLTADLSSPLAKTKMDITKIEQDNGTFDVIICNHVLEHIQDDAKAILELFRVLRPSGFAILQVPISYSIESTIEDPSITNPRDRERHFGQRDHVRIYGRDYTERLEQAGFSVKVHDFIAELKPEDVHKYGLSTDEKIYLCSK